MHALTSTGRYSGVLIDIGEAGTDITVVVNGEISSQSNSISRAGHLISTALFASLQSAIPDLEYLSAVKLKERSAFVSQNLQEDVSSPLCIQKGRFDLLMKSFDQRANTSLVSQLPRELWPEICYFASCFATSHKFTTLGPQLCRCVEAAFFENKLAPEVMLLPDAIHSAMRGHPPSTLEILSRNIVLTGGTSLLPGIVVREENCWSFFPSAGFTFFQTRNGYRVNLQRDLIRFRFAYLEQEIQPCLSIGTVLLSLLNEPTLKVLL